ncbi:MAG: YfiR family protein [Bacteroidales bacterium]
MLNIKTVSQKKKGFDKFPKTRFKYSKWSLVRFLLLNFAFISLFQKLLAQQVDEYLLKSVFILKIPSFIEWPVNANYNAGNKDFVIAIMGADPFKGKLPTLIKSEQITIKNKQVVVKLISKPEESFGCDMLFISSSEKYNITKILTLLAGKPILTISDSKAFTEKGVMINLYVAGEKLAFDVNLKKALESNIYISSKFLVNANKVEK